MSSIKLNSKPTKIKFSSSAETAEATEGYNVITVTPSGNYEANTLITYGGSSDNLNVPAGSPVLYPLIQQFNNSVVRVTNQNTQEDTSLLSGWYALSQSPDYKLSSSSKNVDQYKSIGGQSTSAIQTLTLTARSQSATLALVIVGANKPVPVFLNTKKGDLPPIWQTLDNAVFEAGNTYQESKNFFGQTVYIVNLSLTEDATFDARLQ